MKPFRVYDKAVGWTFNIGRCKNACKYCYAAGGRAKPDSLTVLSNAINRGYNDTMLGYFIENRYPVAINNHSDFFNCVDKSVALQETELLKDAGFPVYFETKGPHTESDLSWFMETADPKTDLVYLTIETFDEEKRKMLAPFAPSVQKRIRFLDTLLERGYHVEVGVNPLIEGYVTQEEIIGFMQKYERYNNGQLTWYFQFIHLDNAAKLSTGLSVNEIPIDKLVEYTFKQGWPVNGNIWEFEKCVKSALIEREHFGKPMIIAADLERVCKENYDYFLPIEKADGTDLENTAIGYTSWKWFYEQCKDNMPEFLVDKNEIYGGMSAGSYFHANLPKKMLYKDYIKMLWNTPSMSSFAKYAKVFNHNDLMVDGEMVYWYHDQPAVRPYIYGTTIKEV